MTENYRKLCSNAQCSAHLSLSLYNLHFAYTSRSRRDATHKWTLNDVCMCVWYVYHTARRKTPHLTLTPSNRTIFNQTIHIHTLLHQSLYIVLSHVICTVHRTSKSNPIYVAKLNAYLFQYFLSNQNAALKVDIHEHIPIKSPTCRIAIFCDEFYFNAFTTHSPKFTIRSRASIIEYNRFVAFYCIKRCMYVLFALFG